MSRSSCFLSYLTHNSHIHPPRMLPANLHLRQHPQQSSSHNLNTAADADRWSPGIDDYSPKQRTHYCPRRFATICGVIGALVFVSSVAWWAALASSFPLFAFKSLATDTLASSSPLQPWVGPHALVAPSVSNSSNIHNHVRIVIRVHHEHKHLVQGLIHNFRFQQKLSSESPDEATLSMDFALVATELRGVPVTQEIARDFWVDPSNPFPHVYALDLSESFYKAAFDSAAPLKCTSEEEIQIARIHGESAVRKVCQYDNHVYYQATDVALRELLEQCPWCTHAVVTNDDNGYHPDYFKETLLELNPPLKEGEAPRPKYKRNKRKKNKKTAPSKSPNGDSQTKREKRALAAAVEHHQRKRWDLVTTDFTTSNILKHAKWALGDLDLGSVLLSKEIINKIGGFIAALPPQATAMDAHNADWLFTEKALKMGALAKVVKKLLFFHN